MTKRKKAPKSQSRQYKTKSRAIAQQEKAKPDRTWWYISGGLVIVLAIVAIVVLTNRQSNQSQRERPLAEIAPAERANYYSTPPEMEIDTSSDYQARIVTEKGDVLIDLYEKESPITVNNFVFLARQGYYDNTTFHRVIENFMAQGGDPTGTGSGGPGYQFADETENGLTFDQAGLLAMANAGANTNGSQFFITFVPTPHLNGNHTIFGLVIEGMDVLNSTTFRDPTTNPDYSGDLIKSIDITKDGQPL